MPIVPLTLAGTEVSFTPEEEARFREAVRKGIEQADQGKFVEEEEMDARVRRMFSS